MLLAKFSLLLSLSLHHGVVLSYENAGVGCKSNGSTQNCEQSTKQNNQCQIYLAESSIPNAGLGMYTTSEIKEKEYLQSEISIPLSDMNETILDSYYWDAIYRGQFLEALLSKEIIPGLGMAANGARGLANVKITHPIELDVSKLHEDDKFLFGDRSTPDVGSYSDYAMHQWHATRDIPAGMEIFAEYGDAYFENRATYPDDMPLKRSYKEADNVIRNFLKFLIERQDSTTEQRQAWWNEKLKSLNKRTYNALPKEVDLLIKVIEKGGSALYALPHVIRTKEWLEENGLCMDNILVKKTTLENHNGRGAFARRFIPKGSLVAPAPLLHFKNDSIFHLLDVDYDPRISKTNFTKNNHNKDDGVVPKQLFVNYCFGHSDSSLLFFPYSTRVQLINHDITNYNTELRWSKLKNHKSSWLDLPFSELPDSQGLIMDIIATRDIQEGEEIFLNYGEGFQKAYETHVSNWKKPFDHKTYIHAQTMNKNKYNIVIRTKIEQIAHPYPPNIQTVCYYVHPIIEKDISFYEGTVELDYHYNQDKKDDSLLLPCDVLERSMSDEGVQMYHVKIFPLHNSKLAYPIIVKNLTIEKIKFAPNLYSTNIFEKTAFRHFIEIPDDIFPEKWKNVKK